MDILKLLDELNEMAVLQPKSLGPIVWGLDQHQIEMHISKIRACLPEEVKAAVQTIRESDRIVESAREDAEKTVENSRREADRVIAEARQEAERIIEQARLQQNQMVSESEILKLAKAQSEEIRNAADRDAVQMRRGAEKYAIDVLGQLEGVVGKVMTTIERGKQEMKPMDPAPALVQNRDREVARR